MFTFKLRRGTASEWTAANTLLSAGEPGVESDTMKFKIGDGVHRWSELPYYLTQDAMAIFVNEAVATAVPITPEQIDDIVDTVENDLALPDLVLLWDNATT